MLSYFCFNSRLLFRCRSRYVGVSLHPQAKMAATAAVLSANHYSYYRLLFSRNAVKASMGSKISILIAYFADQLKVALEHMYIMP